MSRPRIGVETRARAMDAFCGDDPPPMTYADLDKRLTRALNATVSDLRTKAGLDEGKPSRPAK